MISGIKDLGEDKLKLKFSLLFVFFVLVNYAQVSSLLTRNISFFLSSLLSLS